jgi:hypothetical protein
MQLAQASTFAVGEDDLRDVEDDPVIAHVLESPFELHRAHPFEARWRFSTRSALDSNHFTLLARRRVPSSISSHKLWNSELALQRVIMLGELAVNRALDNIDP